MVGQGRNNYRSSFPVEKTQGWLILQVGDILESGGAKRRDTVDKLSKNYQFSQDEDLSKLSGSTLNRWRLAQGREGRIALKIGGLSR